MSISVPVRTLAAAMAMLAVAPAIAQPPQFEVAVIRPAQAATTAGTSFEVFDGGRLRITNEPVKLLIRAAFQLQDVQIANAPAWLGSDRYDIEAKTGLSAKPKPAELSPLLQDLLAERFHLRFHKETRELPVYALVAAGAEKKLSVNREGANPGMNTSGGRQKIQAKATAVPMSMLAMYIGNRLGRLVVDRTELAGSYDFTLEWSPEETSDSTVPSLTTALKEQLGLKLEPARHPVEVLVIDGIEKPTGN